MPFIMSQLRIKFVARVMLASLLFMVTIFYSRAQSCVTGISTNTLNFSSGSDCEDVYVDLYPEWCDTWVGITYEDWITPYEDYDFGILVICVDEHTQSGEPRVGYVYIGSYTITVTQSGVCALPDAPAGISGLSTRSFNSLGSYSISPVYSATGYWWGVNNGGSITTGQGTTQVEVSFPDTGLTTLSVYAINGCGNGDPASVGITVKDSSEFYLGSIDRNYIFTRTPGVPLDSLSDKVDPEKVQAGYQYYDGLGRLIQSVQVHASPQLRDIVTHTEYDMFGRQEKQYLPYSHSQLYNNGSFVVGSSGETLDFYGSEKGDTLAYSRRVYESSPLNRVLTQGFPGSPWQPADTSISGSGHTVDFGYSVNGSNEVRLWRVSDSIVSTGYYGAGELQKTVTEDEKTRIPRAPVAGWWNIKTGRGGLC